MSLSLYLVEKQKEYLIATGLDPETGKEKQIADLKERYPSFSSDDQHARLDQSNPNRVWIDFGSPDMFYMFEYEKAVGE